MKRNLYVGASFRSPLIALGVASAVLNKKAVAGTAPGRTAPKFEVDPMWPKPLPNHWVMGNVIGVSVDSQGSYLDHSSAGIARGDGRLRRGQSAQGAKAAQWRRGIGVLRPGAAGAGVRRSRAIC